MSKVLSRYNHGQLGKRNKMEYSTLSSQNGKINKKIRLFLKNDIYFAEAPCNFFTFIARIYQKNIPRDYLKI